MSGTRRDGRRAGRHAFRPDHGGPLEQRTLLSTGQAEVSRIADMILAAKRQGKAEARRPRAEPQREARHPIQTFVKAGGQAVRIRDPQGEYFDVTVQGTGTVRATPMPTHDGRVRIIVLGTTSSSNLVIAPARPRRQPGKAHTFNPVFGIGDELLNVGAIELRSGRIGQILGFRTVNLSGPIEVRGESRVDRIALNRILPGGSITVNEDLDTLDIFVDANFSGAESGLFIGRDLNWTNVRGDLTFSDGATASIGRDLGLLAQPNKGTAIGGQGLLVQGNFVINPGSTFTINRNLAGPLVVRGNFNGTSRLIVRGSIQAGTQVLGTVTP
jgi:hypothetical protein